MIANSKASGAAYSARWRCLFCCGSASLHYGKLEVAADSASRQTGCQRSRLNTEEEIAEAAILSISPFGKVSTTWRAQFSLPLGARVGRVWHIECSAMVRQELGTHHRQFTWEVADLIFPLLRMKKYAQSEAATR